MRYEGRVFRPPSEAHSLIIQATVGCSHNQCTFCDMYKEKQFHVRKLADVLEDLRLARQYYSFVRRIFLADGDALILGVKGLEPILTEIQKLFPECERVGVYGSPQSILRLSAGELSSLAGLGVGIVYMGLESGCDEILQAVKKGFTAGELVQAGLKVKEARIPLSVTAISGLGGVAKWEEHALHTAAAFSEMKPDYIGLLTLMLEGQAPMVEQVRRGEFTLLSPRQVAMETKKMLEHIDAEGSIFRSNHASNYLSLRGTLNRDREAMVNQLEAALQGNAPFKPEDYRLL